jgi:hypothetical protein
VAAPTLVVAGLVVDDAFSGHADGIRAGHPRLAHVVHEGSHADCL